MTLLIIGVLLWAGIHLVKALAPSMRQGMIDSMGKKAYRGLVALGIFGSLVLIVLGWRSTPEEYLYVLPTWTRTVAFLLICASFVVLGSAHYPSAIKRVIRHPMLTGLVIWAAGHLIVNGTVRAWVLFGGLGVWALLEIILINRREGPYTRPEAPGFGTELKGVFISGAILLVVLLGHPYFAGVSPFPR